MLLPEASFFRLWLICVHTRITLDPIHHLISRLSFETASLTLGPFYILLRLFSCSVLSDCLAHHGLQHTRLPCPSLSPRVCSNSCPLCLWCHLTISSSVVPFSCLQSSSIRVFSNESVPCIRWPKYWSFSFSISPSNEYSGLISFRMDWFDLLAVQETLKSLLQHHRSKHQFFGAQPSLWLNSHIHI